MDISVILTREGPGSIIVIIALTTALVSYAALIRWIAHGGQEEERPPWERMGWPFE